MFFQLTNQQKQYIEIGAAAIGLIAIITPFKGDFLPPVTGKLTSKFGPRIDPVTKAKTEFHNGQDVAVPIGTQVKAPRNGIIKNTTPSESGGNQVVMVLDNGYFVGFAHLSKVLVKPGQKVKKGEVIALSGNTGKHTTAAHLHVTMKTPKGVLVDPTKYINFKKVA